MNLRVERQVFSERSTIGQLFIDDVRECFTLEPRKDRSQGKPYCIDCGLYSFVLLKSPRFLVVTPHIVNVPGFTDIEIHFGNFPANTEGCTLVGEVYQPSAPDFIGKSQLAFANLMMKIKTAGFITYEEKP